MSIPFTQYVLPHGRRMETSIERPADIETAAQNFIDAGGRYECEALTTGHISLTACMDTGEDGWQDVEIQLCANNSDVTDATDRLVLASIKHIPDIAAARAEYNAEKASAQGVHDIVEKGDLL